MADSDITQKDNPMTNPWRVKVENRRIVNRGYLCPICGEYDKRSNVCKCVDVPIVKKVKKTKKKAKKVSKDIKE